MQKKLLLYCLLLLGVTVNRLSAQGLNACQGSSTAAATCATTCINCNLEGITGITNVPLAPGAPNSLCHDEITLENPRWYGFIAATSTLSIAITPTNCQTGQGLEASIVDNCVTTLTCLPGPNLTGASGAFIITSTTLVPGRPYQLVIDGFNGDVCNFALSIVNGSSQAPPIGPISPITGLSQVCPNATVTYTIPPVSNAVSYTWTSPVGSSINGGSNVRTFPANGNNSVDITFGNSGGNVCVVASNACSPDVSTCINVSNTPIPPTQLEERIVCYEELPFIWDEEPHPFVAIPGTFNLTSTAYTSYLGCDSIVKQTLKVMPLNQVNLPVKYLCKNECFSINGLDYCDAGSYQEHLTASTGCDSVVNFTLIRIPSKAVIVPPDTITCSVTSVPLSGAGSTTGNTVSYQWLNPAGQVISNAITATAHEPGLHSLIVTNYIGGNACKDTATVDVPGNLTPPLAEAGPDRVLTCIVTQVQLQGSGSVGSDFTYFWKALGVGNIVSGASTLTPVVNAVGIYSLKVTNTHNGCTAVSNAVVTAQITPPSIIATGGTFTCADPTVTLLVSTNASSPTFNWSGPNSFTSTQQNPEVNVAGTYTVLVTNGVTGCTSTSSVIVNAATDTPTATATGGNITCVANSVTLSGSSTTPGVTYSWTGPNNFTSNLANPVVSTVGNYTLVVTAPTGCTNTAIATVGLNTTPPGTVLSSSSSLNCNNASVNLLATSTGNPANLDHVWTLVGGGTQSTGSASFLAVNQAGNYSVLVTNTVSGCTSTATFNLVQYPNVGLSFDKEEGPKCFDSNDGTISALATGGNGVYSYQWSNGATTALNTGLGGGVYLVTVTDGENCSATASATLVTPLAISANATATPQSANGTTDGTATAAPTGGTPDYTYEWSTGETTASIAGLAPGSYTVTIHDANGCSKVAIVTVNQYNCLIQSDVTVANISCFGQTNGSATAVVTGATDPITYAWSTGASTASIADLAAGEYTVSITDGANCPLVESFTIVEPTSLQANATGSTTSGYAATDGTATANPTGGTGAYSYNWSNGETTQTINNLGAGIYTVIVSDENGCSVSQEVEVVAGNCSLITDFVVTNPTCHSSTDGSATIVLTGGAGGFTFNWSTGGTTETETNLAGDIEHFVSVTDANGCQIVAPVTLAAPPAISISVLNTTNTTCADSPEGTATVEVSGGTGALNVHWSDGQTGLVASELVAGTYTAIALDENGCSSSVMATVVSNDTEAPVILTNPVMVPIGPNGDVTLTAQNINAYITDNCGLESVVIEPSTFNCLELGDHVVTITATDGAGHTTVKNATVTIVDNTDPILVCSPSLVRCAEDNQVSYQAPTASDNCLINGGDFHIIAGLPIGAIFPTGSTTTTYEYTDAQGNVGTCSFEVTILTPLVLVVDTVYNDFNFQHIGAAFVNVSGSLPPYTFNWTSNGQQVSTSQNLTGVGAGVYTLVVTDDNGCSVASQTIEITNTSETKTPVSLEEIRVFPNPTSGNLSVLLPDVLLGDNVFMQIFDQTGRRVLTQASLQDKQIDLQLANLADGLYSLVIRIDNQQIVRKIVLNR